MLRLAHSPDTPWRPRSRLHVHERIRIQSNPSQPRIPRPAVASAELSLSASSGAIRLWSRRGSAGVCLAGVSSNLYSCSSRIEYGTSFSLKNSVNKLSHQGALDRLDDLFRLVSVKDQREFAIAVVSEALRRRRWPDRLAIGDHQRTGWIGTTDIAVRRNRKSPRRQSRRRAAASTGSSYPRASPSLVSRNAIMKRLVPRRLI